MVWCWIPLKTGINLSCVCSAGGRLCSLVKYRINVYFLKRSLRGPDGFCSVSLRIKAQTAAFVEQWISPSSFAILLTVAETITHTHSHTPSMVVHATVTPSGLALAVAALYRAIKKAIILFKGIDHFRGGRGVSTLGFSKRGKVQSIRSIPQVSLVFHQTG